MPFFKISAALAIAIVTSPVVAKDEPAAAPDPIVVNGAHDAESKGEGKEKKVCVREASTGSIMAKRVCRSVREIASQQRISQDSLDRMRPVAASGIANPE